MRVESGLLEGGLVEGGLGSLESWSMPREGGELALRCADLIEPFLMCLLHHGHLLVHLFVNLPNAAADADHSEQYDEADDRADDDEYRVAAGIACVSVLVGYHSLADASGATGAGSATDLTLRGGAVGAANCVGFARCAELSSQLADQQYCNH